jgi:hypothetical protein
MTKTMVCSKRLNTRTHRPSARSLLSSGNAIDSTHANNGGDHDAIEPLLNHSASSTTARPAWRIAIGQSRTPWSVVVAPTHTNNIAAPALNKKSPNRAARAYAGADVGMHAAPSARSAMPAKRANRTPGPSNSVAKSSRDPSFGLATRAIPTTISSHAAALTRYFCGVIISHLERVKLNDSRGLLLVQHGTSRSQMHSSLMNEKAKYEAASLALPLISAPRVGSVGAGNTQPVPTT